MALQKSLVHLSLTGGADGKGDDLLTDPSKLDLAKNVEFDDSNTVKTRAGQVKSTLPSGYATAIRMFAHKDTPVIETERGDMVRANNSTLPSYVGEASSSVDLYEPTMFPRVGVDTRRVDSLNPSNSSYLLTAAGFDVAYGTTTYAIFKVGPINPTVFTYNAVQLSIRSTQDDRELAVYYWESAAATDLAILPRVIYDSTNDRFAMFWLRTDTTLNLHSVQGAYVPAVGGSAVDVPDLITFNAALGANNAQMDAAIYQGQGYALAVVDPSGAAPGTVKIKLLTLALAELEATQSRAPAVRPASLTAHATYSGGKLTGHAFWAGVATNLYGCNLEDDGTISVERTIRATGSRYGRIVAYTSGGVDYLAVDTIDSTAGTNTAITGLFSINSVTLAVIATGPVYANCFIAGRRFTMRSRDCIPLVFTSTNDQGTILVVDVSDRVGIATIYSPVVVARLGYGEVNYNSDLEVRNALASRVPGSDASLLPYVASETNLRLAGGTRVTPLALFLAKFSPTAQLGDAELNGIVHLAGAAPMIYDGKSMVEEGFHWGPEITNASGTAITPIATAADLFTFPGTTGTYTVVFTLAWQDAQGNWHESAPSPEYTVAIDMAGAPGNLSIGPDFALPPSLKRGVYILMYRTLISSTDTSLYLAHTGSLGGTQSGTTIRFASEVMSEVSEATLASSEQLYTAGNVLPNTPAPSCRHVSLFQKRLVLSGCGDGSEVHWSKQSTPGYGVEFSSGDPTHRTVVPRQAGRVVATREMDDRLWIVCENSVGVISGTGPDPTGTQGQYSDFSTTVPEIGASWDSPKSVIRGPEGIWFRSPLGIRLVSRSGTLARGQSGQELGAEVDDLVSGNLVATSGSANQQIRFYQSSGSVLVWDFQFGQWSQFTGFGNVDAIYAGGRHYHVTNVSTTPLLRYTSSSVFVDVNDAGTANSLFTSTIRTGWLSLAGIQGFQRVFRLMMLGKSVGGAGAQPWDIAGTLYYDFVESSGTETFSTTATPSGSIIQLQHHLAHQKCESLKIQLTFTPDTSSIDYAFRLTDLTLQVGLKPGYFKLPSAKRI